MADTGIRRVISRAWRDTGWFHWKSDILPTVVATGFTALGIYWEEHGEETFKVSHITVPVAFGIVGLLIYWLLINAAEFGWNLVHARGRIIIEELTANLATARTVAVESQALAKIAIELIESDGAQLSQLVSVHDIRVDWAQTYKTWIVSFSVLVVNRSLFSLTPRLPMGGRISCSAGGNPVQCSRQIELRQTSGYTSAILHGASRNIWFDQQLDEHDTGVVWGSHGPRDFDFSAIEFFFESEAPDGRKGPVVRLPMPGSFIVPEPQSAGGV